MTDDGADNNDADNNAADNVAYNGAVDNTGNTTAMQINK